MHSPPIPRKQITKTSIPACLVLSLYRRTQSYTWWDTPCRTLGCIHVFQNICESSTDRQSYILEMLLSQALPRLAPWGSVDIASMCPPWVIYTIWCVHVLPHAFLSVVRIVVMLGLVMTLDNPKSCLLLSWYSEWHPGWTELLDRLCHTVSQLQILWERNPDLYRDMQNSAQSMYHKKQSEICVIVRLDACFGVLYVTEPRSNRAHLSRATRRTMSV